MPISPNALAIIGIVASFSAVIAALVSGIFVLVNSRIANKKTTEIEQLKSELSGEIERMKARLGHGQVVSATQWNAEFSSYQAIWKALVAVRAQATKIVFRESELIEIGLPDSYLDRSDRVNLRKDLVSNFTNATQGLLWAIHDNAPFYPAPIREQANNAHSAAKGLIDKHLIAFTSYAKGVDITKNERFVAVRRHQAGLLPPAICPYRWTDQRAISIPVRRQCS